MGYRVHHIFNHKYMGYRAQFLFLTQKYILKVNNLFYAILCSDNFII